MRFESKRDWWIVLLLRGMPFLVFAVIVIGWDARHRGMAGPVVGLILLVGAQIFLLEGLMRSTYYLIEGDTLIVRSGIVRWRIPIRSIRSITPTRSAQSSPALSLDRLRIEYDDSKSVMVSPEEKVRFIEALRAINSTIAV